MANSIWSYLQNPFDNVTKKSNKHMFLMATDHFDKLNAHKADPKIKELYLFGKPYFYTPKDSSKYYLPLYILKYLRLT